MWESGAGVYVVQGKNQLKWPTGHKNPFHPPDPQHPMFFLSRGEAKRPNLHPGKSSRHTFSRHLHPYEISARGKILCRDG